jgi:hypothetical protein
MFLRDMKTPSSRQNTHDAAPTNHYREPVLPVGAGSQVNESAPSASAKSERFSAVYTFARARSLSSPTVFLAV